MFDLPRYQPTIEITENKIKMNYGILDFRFKFYISKLIKKKLNILFINFTSQYFEFYKFFAIEVTEILNVLLEERSNDRNNKLNLKMVKSLIDLLNNEYWEPMKKTKYKLNYDKLKHYLRYGPLEHQKIAFETYEEVRSLYGYRGMLLDAGVGSGKSFMSIALSLAFNSNKTIVIAPLQTIDKVWYKTLAGNINDPEMIFKEKQPVYFSKYNKTYQNESYLVFHYEDLHKLEKMIKELRNDNLTIIIDESHNFADSKTKRTKLLIDIVNKLNPNNVIPMSGTPIKSSVNELNIIFKLIVENYDKTIENRFLKIYKSPGYLFTDLLKMKYSKYVIKIKKSDIKLEPITTIYKKIKLANGDNYILENIKEEMKTYYETKLEDYRENFINYEAKYMDLYKTAKNANNKASERQFKEYENNIKKIVKVTKNGGSVMNPSMLPIVSTTNKFEKEEIIPYLNPNDKKEFKNVKSIYKYPKLKVIGEMLANVIMKKRRECVRDIAYEFNYIDVIDSTLKKTIVFSSYIEVCDTANIKLKELKYKPLSVYGSTSKDLSIVVGKFTSIEKYNPLVTTYKSLSTGVPLIIANHIIALDVPFRRYIYEQAIGRAWRTGQDKPINVYIPELDTGDEPNINDRNLDIMKFYVDVVNDITGDDIPEDMLDKNVIKEDNIISVEDYYIDKEISNSVKTNTYDKFNEW